MIIREVEKKDLDKLKEMAIEFEKEYLEMQLSVNSPYTSLNEDAEEKIMESIEEDMNSSNKKILIAEKEGEIVGHVMISRKKIAGDIYNVTEIGSMTFLGVKKKFRKKGIALKLYSEAMRLLKEMGLEYVSVMTCLRNKDAYLLYKKAGFEEYETEFLKKI